MSLPASDRFHLLPTGFRFDILVLAIVTIIPGFIWAREIDKRVIVTETRIEAQMKTNSAQDRRLEQFQIEMREQFKTILGKLDRLTERSR